MKRINLLYLVCVASLLILSACSTTKKVSDGDQLYVGLTKIKYESDTINDHFYTTRDEVEAALACAPMVLYSVVPIIVRRFLMHFGFGMHSQMRLIP